MMKAERKINRMWQEWNTMPAKMQKGIRQNAAFIAKWQHSYSSERGRIDMIHMTEAFPKKTFWEICCLEGKLMNDTERFDTKKQAEKRIRQILEGKRKK
jgi:phosphorylcholine metabolism protein LicD